MTFLTLLSGVSRPGFPVLASTVPLAFKALLSAQIRHLRPRD
jgi:hypothetical protein